MPKLLPILQNCRKWIGICIKIALVYGSWGRTTWVGCLGHHFADGWRWWILQVWQNKRQILDICGVERSYAVTWIWLIKELSQTLHGQDTFWMKRKRKRGGSKTTLGRVKGMRATKLEKTEPFKEVNCSHGTFSNIDRSGAVVHTELHMFCVTSMLELLDNGVPLLTSWQPISWLAVLIWRLFIYWNCTPSFCPCRGPQVHGIIVQMSTYQCRMEHRAGASKKPHSSIQISFAVTFTAEKIHYEFENFWQTTWH